MVLAFGNYVIDANPEKTREIYRALPLISQSCGFVGCRNFEKAMDALPEPVLQIEFQANIPRVLNGENTYPRRLMP